MRTGYRQVNQSGHCVFCNRQTNLSEYATIFNRYFLNRSTFYYKYLLKDEHEKTTTKNQEVHGPEQSPCFFLPTKLVPSASKQQSFIFHQCCCNHWLLIKLHNAVWLPHVFFPCRKFWKLKMWKKIIMYIRLGRILNELGPKARELYARF